MIGACKIYNPHLIAPRPKQPGVKSGNCIADTDDFRLEMIAERKGEWMLTMVMATRQGILTKKKMSNPTTKIHYLDAAK